MDLLKRIDCCACFVFFRSESAAERVRSGATCAGNLQRLACELTEGGQFDDRTLPADEAALRSLPGIGAYTAGAVSSFAYERRAALVDTNVARVLKRAFAPEVDVNVARGRKLLWQV